MTENIQKYGQNLEQMVQTESFTTHTETFSEQLFIENDTMTQLLPVMWTIVRCFVAMLGLGGGWHSCLVYNEYEYCR